MGSVPYRPYLACLTHGCTPAILVALTAIAITPCRWLAIAAPPARCPRLTRTPAPPADPAIASRQARAQATSCLGDTARNPLSRPAAPPGSRRLAIAADPATSRPAATRPHPRRHLRRTSPRRAGPAAVPVIPAKWCGDTIAHTRKLRF